LGLFSKNASPTGNKADVAFPSGACQKRRWDAAIGLKAMDHTAYSDTYIADILREARVIAMVGASGSSNRPSYFAMKYLLGKGYRVLPINPTAIGQSILGQPVLASLAELAAPVDIVDIFRGSKAALEITREAIALKDKLGIKVIWMQLGVRNEEAAAAAAAANLKVVMNRCPKIEYGRLSGEIGWAGVNAGAISSKRPLLGQRGVQNHVLAGRR
jgi:predicted CoA-binding protein